VDWLWRLRDLALPLLYGLPGKAQPIAYIEDVGIPSEHLAHYLHRVQDILQKFQTTASFLIHAGAGQVHTRPFLDVRRPENVDRLKAIAEQVYAVVFDLGGTISAQHAVGLARTPWVPQQYGRLFQVLRDVKAIFDPHQRFNPGKLVGSDGDPNGGNLRREATARLPGPAGNLRWTPGEVQAQCHTCNGCGSCRTEAPGQRMCPLFRVEHTEAATPRAKANLLRSLLDGTLPAEQLASDEVRGVANLCINCKMCALECPAHVDIPRLMLETKAIHVAEHGLSRGDWLLARAEDVSALGSRLARFLNPALGNRGFRWLLERFLGIARQRRLPRFAPRSFLDQAARRGWTRPPRRRAAERVAYFVDVYANYHDPQLAEATVAVLHSQGVEVYVPPGQVGCGMAPLAVGDVDTARQMAERNLRVFADLARDGFTIVCSEPTAAFMLRHDYRHLVEDPDVQLVADRTTELTAFLWELHRQGRLRTDFRPVPLAVGHHVPCHAKALQLGVAGPKLLSLIPHFRPLTIDVSCSGMAGTFGLKRENFEASLAVGEPMLQRLRSEALLFGSSECSACRLQMEQGAHKRSLHPIQYLAYAYGLMPEVAQRLREPVGA
jgi:Fe-S oxidoreductase